MMQTIFKKIRSIGRASYKALCLLIPSRRNWPVMVILLLSFITVGVVIGTSPAHAIPGMTEIANGLIWAVSQILLMIARFFMSMTLFFLQFFIQLASYNGFVSVPTVLLGWSMIRDISNMFFIVALLVIAFSTILGVEKYEWQKAMVKLVLAAILVNFSKLIAGIIIDASHVFTVTFVNAISAVAGGNLISMFKFDAMRQMIQPSGSASPTANFDIDLLAGAFFALLFSAIAMFTIGAYAVILLIRMVALWVLIILSPLAYIFAVIPQTKKHSDRWWKEFSSNVIVAPIMVFFLWLAFATMGSGEIGNSVLPPPSDLEQRAGPEFGTDPSATLNAASTWESMSTILIAVAFLLVGARVTKESGAAGAGLAEKGVELGKKAASIFGGVSAGRFLAKKAWGGTKGLAKDYGLLTAGKLGLRKLPVVGDQSAGKLRRKAALAKQDEYYQTRAKKITAEAAKGGRAGGVPGLFAPKKETMAQMAMDANTAERDATSAQQTIEGELKIKISGDEMANLKSNYDSRVAAKGPTITDEEKSEIWMQEAGKTKMMGSLLREAEAKAKTGKGQSREEQIAATAATMLRSYQGKTGDPLVEWEDKENQDDAAKMARLDFDPLFEIIEKNYKTAKTLGAKVKSGTATDIEKTRFSNAVKSQGVAMASVYDRGWGENAHEKLKALDSTFADVDFNDPNQNHIADMALMSGGTLDDFVDASATGTISDKLTDPKSIAKQAALQEDVIRKQLKEKSGATMRGLMRSKNKDASDHGSIESSAQLLEGRDKNGDKTVGFANLMAGGTPGTASVIGTGVYDASGSAVNGKARREAKTAYNFDSARLDKIGGGSMVTGSQKDSSGIEVATGYTSLVAGKIRSIANMSDSEIKSKLTPDQINRITGGTYQTSSWDNKSNRFVIPAAMQPSFGAIFEDFRANFNSTKNETTRDNHRKSLRTFLLEAKVPQGEAQRIVDEVMPGVSGTATAGPWTSVNAAKIFRGVT